MNKKRYSATEFGGNKPMNFRPSGTLTNFRLFQFVCSEIQGLDHRRFSRIQLIVVQLKTKDQAGVINKKKINVLYLPSASVYSKLLVGPSI